MSPSLFIYLNIALAVLYYVLHQFRIPTLGFLGIDDSSDTFLILKICFQENVVPCLLKLRESRNTEIAEHANQALCLVGHVNPVGGRGIRILTIDGGGTR